jgi:hypothetical protein
LVSRGARELPRLAATHDLRRRFVIVTLLAEWITTPIK